MKIINLFIFVLHLFATIELYSQAIWSNVYGGKKHDDGRAVIQTHDNGYLFVCTTQSFGHGSVDIWLIKTSEFGDTLWTKTYGGNFIDAAENPQCILQTDDNGLIIVGSTMSFGSDLFDLWLIKTDSSGNEIWNKKYGGEGRQDGVAIIGTKDGSYLILGHQTTGRGDIDLWLLKADTNGDTIWTKTYGGNFSDFGYCLSEDYNDGYVIGGTTTYTNTQPVWLLKINSIGDTIWTKRYNEEENNQIQSAYSIHLNNENGYTVLAKVIDRYGNRYPWLFKVNSFGEIQISKTIKDQFDSFYIDITSGEKTYDNGYIITGEVESPQYISNLLLIKTDNMFNILWSQVSQNSVQSNRVRGWAVKQTNDEGYIIAGWFEDNALLIKANSTGQFVTPTYTNVIKNEEKQYIHSLGSNYPNPFNSSTKITYTISNSEIVILKIKNLLGQDVKTLVNTFQRSGVYKIIWDGKDDNGNLMPSGVYLYYLHAGVFKNSKKLLLIK